MDLRGGAWTEAPRRRCSLCLQHWLLRMQNRQEWLLPPPFAPKAPDLAHVLMRPLLPLLTRQPLLLLTQPHLLLLQRLLLAAAP